MNACPQCGLEVDLEAVATNPEIVRLVMANMARKKKGVPLNLSLEEKMQRSARMTTYNLNRAAANRILKLPRPKKKP